MSSTLNDYSNETPSEQTVQDRAPDLIDEGTTREGQPLHSITVDGLRYYLVRRNNTTLQLRSVERVRDGVGIPSDVVSGIVYEDLPDAVRLTLKVEEYRMTGKNSLLDEVL